MSVQNGKEEIDVKCVGCEKTYKLQEAMRERSMPSPHDQVTEGYLLCPHCNFFRHIYFLSLKTARIRYNLRIAVDMLEKRKTVANIRMVRLARESHQRAFDQDQKDYAFLIEGSHEHTPSP